MKTTKLIPFTLIEFFKGGKVVTAAGHRVYDLEFVKHPHWELKGKISGDSMLNVYWDIYGRHSMIEPTPLDLRIEVKLTLLERLFSLWK